MSSIGSVTSSSATTSVAAPAASSAVSNNLATVATQLSKDAGVIATLGASGTTLNLYDAAGLLDSIAKAGTSDAGGSSGDSAAASADQQIVDGLSGNSSAVPVQTIANSDLSGNWATVLNTNPNAASLVVAASYQQGIIATI